MKRFLKAHASVREGLDMFSISGLPQFRRTLKATNRQQDGYKCQL
jgi:hypothetical protein